MLLAVRFLLLHTTCRVIAAIHTSASAPTSIIAPAHTVNTTPVASSANSRNTLNLTTSSFPRSLRLGGSTVMLIADGNRGRLATNPGASPIVRKRTL